MVDASGHVDVGRGLPAQGKVHKIMLPPTPTHAECTPTTYTQAPADSLPLHTLLSSIDYSGEVAVVPGGHWAMHDHGLEGVVYHDFAGLCWEVCVGGFHAFLPPARGAWRRAGTPSQVHICTQQCFYDM